MDEQLKMQSYGFSQLCGQSPVASSQIACLEKAIIGSGQVFSTVEEFYDAVYLMSLAGRFRYKFKRNSPQHMTMICNAETCPWKITACAEGATSVVQVHTFRNIHNHSVEDASFGQPTVHTKQGGCMVDDVEVVLVIC